ncbi:hypothetical protein J1N35_018875 [Gossypium stocksii]|uniref:Uncharacterized protein n=1 Tax=Gossypium stocksii TaxID=47602 RepID=A0A9D3VRH5_9ROSI|nr:hypothetical protein J1N35_018875 [Gossypium stocksii]
MKRKHQGNASSKRVQLQGFQTEFENLRMKSSESVTNFFIKKYEESRDTDSLTLDELQSSLLVHEQKFVQQDKEEQALKATINPKGLGGGKPRRKDKNEHQNADDDYSTHFKGKTKGRDINYSYGYKQKSVNKSNI